MPTTEAAIKLQTYQIANLNCADCAAKIQQKLSLEPGLENAILNFATSTITLDPRYLEQAEAIMNSIEPGTRIMRENAGVRQTYALAEHRSQLIILAVASLLFIGGLLLPDGLAKYTVFITAYLLVGHEVLRAAFRNLRQGNAMDENFLMSIATLGAFAIGELPEAVGVMLFFNVGELFQSLAVNRSRRSIQALLNIRPETANLLVNGQTQIVSPSTVSPGSLILVKPGERVPLDGVIQSGASFLDTSALTGESVPRRVEAGDQALAGMVNASGVLTIEVTRPYTESAVSRILTLVENATSRKAQTEKFITKFARYYTPIVVALAAAIAIIPPLVLSGASWSSWLYRALTLLVISCPCALVVSVPLTYFAGIGSASRQGVLVKGAQYLEALTAVNTVVFDKTGTLSQGVFRVVEIQPTPDFSEEELLRLAAEAEAHSAHPIATSIREAFGASVEIDEISDYQEIAGQGVRAIINKRTILAGNTTLLANEGVEFTTPSGAGTIVHLAIDKRYAGYLRIADELRDDAADLVSGLRQLGIQKTVMLTGDDQSVATEVAANLGISEVHANLLPEDKLTKLEQIIAVDSADGKAKVAFVGDGINDAPSITRADVGIAMGGLGSDAAIEAADVVLMEARPSKVLNAIATAQRTKKIVIQNVVLALGIKIAFIMLGTVGIANMWMAVFADVGVTLLAVLNATRALKAAKLPKVRL